MFLRRISVLVGCMVLVTLLLVTRSSVAGVENSQDRPQDKELKSDYPNTAARALSAMSSTTSQNSFFKWLADYVGSNEGSRRLNVAHNFGNNIPTLTEALVASNLTEQTEIASLSESSRSSNAADTGST